MHVFKYNDQESYETNFILWRLKNTRERLTAGDIDLSKEEQEKIFDEQYGQFKKSFFTFATK
tara:strand:- start:3772 stop:3957 length:186 start_codon:yes stop_codon:yes gene_type:complete